ncbi:DUF5979 domain-containing protein [Agromyces archimandritae]|uniref:DUF11 domain-containing protein n=1 Tax=Agromyces archimandritae TaxID=2781962 RepID=A0A975FMS0_9MICO|nr:DUF5979 domain-containing protein [Agromyces archimandritae]QTX05328.1 DUF11 domain-containing protein [Agromyces archimandritae]
MPSPAPSRPRRRPSSRSLRRGIAAVLSGLLIAGAGLTAALAAPAAATAAESVSLGAVEARVSDHRGDVGKADATSANRGTTDGYCITYDPRDAQNAQTTWASASGESRTGHGIPSGDRACPKSLDMKQSVIGVRPAVEKIDAEPGTAFPIGQITHYNSPITTEGSSNYFGGTLSYRFADEPEAPLDFDWWLNETPNDAGRWNNGGVDDEFRFLNTVSDRVVEIDGRDYKLVITGFSNVEREKRDGKTAAGLCPAKPGDDIVTDWKTPENEKTTACLYAKFEAANELVVTKAVVGDPGFSQKTFDFASTSTIAGTAFDASAFKLQEGRSYAGSILTGEQVTITEEKLGKDWKFQGAVCADETGPIDVEVDKKGRSLTLTNPGATGTIACTVTNAYTASGALVIEKELVDAGAGYTGTGDAFEIAYACGAVTGTVALGPGESSETITGIPANTVCTVGEQPLDDALLGARFDWAAPAYGGDADAQGTVKIPADKTKTVVVTNTTVDLGPELGSLAVDKTLAGAAEGYVPSDSGTDFAVSWRCTGDDIEGELLGSLPVGTGSTVLSSEIPVGSTCEISEAAPSEALLADPSYVWAAPVVGDAVTIAAGEPASIGLVNTVERVFDLAITKQADLARANDRAVQAGDGFDYVLTVTNVQGGSVAGVTVTDSLPAELALDPTRPIAFEPAADWASTGTDRELVFTSSATHTAHTVVTIRVPVTVVEAAPAPLGEGSGEASDIDFADVVNTAVVSVPGDVDESNNTSTETTPQKQLDAHAFVQCENDVPWVNFGIETSNLAEEPTEATIAWTTADGRTATKTVPASAGRVLWPYAAVDENGVGIAWPGWRPAAEGDVVGQGTIVDAWEDLVKDTSLESYAFSSTTEPLLVTITVNPSQSFTATYPQATPACEVQRDSAISVTKTASVDAVKPGGEFSYALKVRNTGLGAASPVVLSDAIPAELKVTGISTAEAPAFPRWEGCAVTGADEAGFGGVVECTLVGPLGRGVTAPEVVLDVTVAPKLELLTLTNTAVACAAEYDPALPPAEATLCAEGSTTIAVGAPIALPAEADDPAGLASTGFAGGPWAWFAVVLLALGSGASAFVLSRRRRVTGTPEA